MAAFSVQDAQSQRFLPVENSPASLFSISMGGKGGGYTYYIGDTPSVCSRWSRNVLALSVTYGDSSPKGRALGMAGKFPNQVQSCLPREYPFRLLTAFAATFPKGTAFDGGGKVSGIAIRRPLGGAVAVGD